MARLEHFDLLTGVWQDGAFGTRIWSQIRAQLETGGDLNDSERAVLIELISRMHNRPDARKALGIRRRPRVAQRNDEIADRYVYLTKTQKMSAKAAELETRKHFPTVGSSTIRKVIESGELLGSARVRAIARTHFAGKTPKK